MGKKKKRLNRRINPEKSNKMIWAVSLGLLILFGILFIMITGSDSTNNREELYESILSYLKRTEGISDIVTNPDSNSVKIYYEPDPNSRSKIDYKKMSLFAGVKLSNRLKGEKIRFFLIKKPEDKTNLSFTILDGKVIESSGPG